MQKCRKQLQSWEAMISSIRKYAFITENLRGANLKVASFQVVNFVMNAKSEFEDH